MVTVVEYLSAAVKGKPIDGSDVKTLEEARAELIRLRRVAYRVSADAGVGGERGLPCAHIMCAASHH